MSTNWGILAPGKIAHKFATGLQAAPGARLHAIGSRSLERAEGFAREYGATKAFGSYRELAADTDTDIIYIATPHPYHYESALLCLENGKAVLCEKPFTMNLGQLRHLVEVARKRKVFLMEAFWTRFIPGIVKVLEIADSGNLGRVRFLSADFGFRGEYEPSNRLFNPALGGGALMDIGVYTAFISLLLLGKPENIAATSCFAETGVDASTAMIFSYPDDRMASLYCTFTANTPTRADITFDRGRISIEGQWFTPSNPVLYREDGSKEVLRHNEKSNGYQYEAIECMRCLENGLTESPLLGLDFSLNLMEILDRIRGICGIEYPADKH